MYTYDLILLIPREFSDEVRKNKPDSVDELMFKSKDWIDYALFGLTIAQHLEWALSTYIPIRKSDNKSKKVRIISYDDHTELELTNYELDEINPDLVRQLFENRK